MIDHLVIVLVHFLDDKLPKLFIFLVATMEDTLKLVLADDSVAILVKHLEGNLQILSIEEP